MKLTQFQTPLAERVVGAAAAAVFLAGIVSAGLVDTEGEPLGPALSSPALSSTGQTAGTTHDNVVLPPFSTPDTIERTRAGARNGSTNATNGGTGAGSGSQSGAPSSPRSPSSPPSSSPGSNPPAVPSESEPTPSVGVAVGPISVGVSPDGIGGNVGGTVVGDPSTAPDQTGGVSIDVTTGIVPPVVVNLP